MAINIEAVKSMSKKVGMTIYNVGKIFYKAARINFASPSSFRRGIQLCKNGYDIAGSFLIYFSGASAVVNTMGFIGHKSDPNIFFNENYSKTWLATNAASLAYEFGRSIYNWYQEETVAISSAKPITTPATSPLETKVETQTQEQAKPEAITPAKKDIINPWDINIEKLENRVYETSSARGA